MCQNDEAAAAPGGSWLTTLAAVSVATETGHATPIYAVANGGTGLETARAGVRGRGTNENAKNTTACAENGRQKNGLEWLVDQAVSRETNLGTRYDGELGVSNSKCRRY